MHVATRKKTHVAACLGLSLLAACGCALPQQASERLVTTASTAEQQEAPPEKPKPENPPPASIADQKPSPQPKTENVDPQALQEIMTQLHDMRASDPKAHDQLLADLKHVDPKLWPMLVQGFKASREYRDRKQTQAVVNSVATAPRPAPLTAAAEPPAPINSPPAENRPATAPAVQPASHEVARPPADWQQPLEATIRSLEAALAESPGPGEDDRQVYLRLLYLLSGQRDKALRPLAGHDALAQEFWSRELYSLSTYLDTKRVTDRSRRAAEAAVHHWEASNRLSQQGNLLVRNLAFCTEVMSYGVYTPFDRQEFQPGQRVVLYAEVENFLSQPTPRGHHTSFESRYQIFDSRGQKVQEHQFPSMQEHCQNPRRDFFIAYDDVRLPAQLFEGRYKLTLTIEDTLGKKVGQSSLDFQIKPAASQGSRSTR